MLKRSILIALFCAGLGLLLFAMTRDSTAARAGEGQQAAGLGATQLTAAATPGFETCSPIQPQPTCATAAAAAPAPVGSP